MRALNNDQFQLNWFKQEYKISKGYLTPISYDITEEYNPFDFYNPINKKRDFESLHLKFANLNLDDDNLILSFYNNYGPLGLFEERYVKVVAFPPFKDRQYPMPKQSPIAAVQWYLSELVPMDEFIDRFKIPIEKIIIPSSNDLILPDYDELITSKITSESLVRFKEECKYFKWILNSRIAISKKDINQLKTLLNEYPPLDLDIDNASCERLLCAALTHVVNVINGHLAMIVTPRLNWSYGETSFSDSIAWTCRSLISAMYLMLFLDIMDNTKIDRCECGNYFSYSEKKPATYCSPYCYNSAKRKRHYEKHGK